MFIGVMVNPVDLSTFARSCRAIFIGCFAKGKWLSFSLLYLLYLNNMLNQAGLYE